MMSSDIERSLQMFCVNRVKRQHLWNMAFEIATLSLASIIEIHFKPFQRVGANCQPDSSMTAGYLILQQYLFCKTEIVFSDSQSIWLRPDLSTVSHVIGWQKRRWGLTRCSRVFLCKGTNSIHVTLHLCISYLGVLF